MFGAPFVLIVDDDEAISEVLRTLLTEAGYCAVAASDGASGLKLAAQINISLIILDMLMPIANGLDFIREYRETAVRHTPIIATSVSNSYADRALQTGADAFIAKPFHMDVLLERIEDHIYAHPRRKINWS
jgi:DNA-binding response OmpR family regulator